ncbi:hypothetical protein ScPMuIL_013743 [Solemya velum]
MGATCSVSRGVATPIDRVPHKIIMFGLENAGKTQLLYSWKIGSKLVKRTIPTEEFNVETVTSPDGVFYSVWDLSGKASSRLRRRQYFGGAEGLIYVIDSSAHEDIGEVKKDLGAIFGESELSGLPLLFIVTKQDIEGSMTVEKLCEELNLKQVVDRCWNICGVCSLEEDENTTLLKRLDGLIHTNTGERSEML